MGAQFIDYLVGDHFVTPLEHAGHYSEKLVLLPNSYQANDRRRPIGAAPARRDVGLPQDGVVFCCFNQSYKILPEVFAAWMRILAAVPGSVLWLLEWDAAAVRNLRREAGRYGVDAARLVFSPLTSLESHLARMRIADLFLDTFPVNAHTTASEALWAGLPVVTRSGETFVSRVAGSLLHAVAMPELITHSLADYEALVTRLGRAPAEMARLRARLELVRDSAPLFDTPRFARNLEKAYEAMWRNYVSGSPPGPIEL
jgi:protein O-GlcNAc transferase